MTLYEGGDKDAQPFAYLKSKLDAQLYRFGTQPHFCIAYVIGCKIKFCVMATMTKGNVIVENIKVGDIHYEFEYGMGIKCEVITLPVRDDEGYWTWKSKNLTTGKEIDYGVREGMAHYSSNLYDYEAYKVKTWI